MLPTQTTNDDPNAKPCYLHGHLAVLSADGSVTCHRCGLYRGPNRDMVKILIAANAGGKEYARQAAALGFVKPDILKFPAPTAVPASKMAAPPKTLMIPVYVAADGSQDLPSMLRLGSIAVFLGVLASFAGYGVWAFLR